MCDNIFGLKKRSITKSPRRVIWVLKDSEKNL